MVLDDRTINFKNKISKIHDFKALTLTIFDGNEKPVTYQLDLFGKTKITFGRGSENDIILKSKLVSRLHGRFHFKKNQWIIEEKSVYENDESTNGLVYNNTSVIRKALGEGDFIRIDDGVETIPAGVLFVFSVPDFDNPWKEIRSDYKKVITIGRDNKCDIILPHISVSRCHAKITQENGKYYIQDDKSTNGVIVNDIRIDGKQRLHEKDVITITNSKLIFTSTAIYYCCFKKGISVDANHVVIKRGKGKKSLITGNDISFGIKPGELVAIIGGSGAGKSTILNSMCGYLPPSDGDVYINGVHLYQNFDSLKKLIGYVPQTDIVYDNLTLYDMLLYTAKLRLPKDVDKDERNAAIDRAIDLVDLGEKKNSLIKSLSGGQRKRASIAVELLSDPNLLFLDEPASGLDPGTERNLMVSLKEMASNGKTVILVTHSTLQLQMCDKIVFMGKGGNLCFFGSYQEALDFFGVSDMIDVYDMITDHPQKWKEKYNKKTISTDSLQKSSDRLPVNKSKNVFQLPVLCARYLKLIVNDRQRLLLLLIQAPVLALLISLVADGQQFKQYEMTKSLLFALSCSAFWVGMLNSIQEICKERSIVKREYMTGLSLTLYVVSKILVLGILCLIQSILVVSVFALTIGLPEEGLFLTPYLELLISTWLTALASTAMGLFVSSLFSNADRAMTVAPILLMPQILFSGLIFKLEGITEFVSCFAICRWSMEGYGTTVNLNQLLLKMQQQGIDIPHEAEDFFDFTYKHMAGAWTTLILFTVLFFVAARIALVMIKKDNS